MNADILHSFAECLRSAGLEVEAVQADGLLHRCGTTDSVSGRSGLPLLEELAHRR